MSTRLLLDEMFHPRIAAELAARGRDCVAVAGDATLRASADADLMTFAVAQGRALVTNNVVDFERLRRQRIALGEPVPELIYTSDTAFPRDRRFIGRLIAALDGVIAGDLLRDTGGVLWLQPHARRDDAKD